MHIPFEPIVWGFKLNIHLIFEYLAFFIAFRYYVMLKRNVVDPIPKSNRLSIIVGAALGALIGSRLVGWLENPLLIGNMSFIQLMNTKTIMGGLFGGLLGVEWTKKIIGEHQSSGDLFVFPIILGIIIGRCGCFLSGIKDFTYGIPTDFFLGLDLGDGLLRHPLALYEIGFLSALFVLLMYHQKSLKNQHGLLFKVFMIAYFSFRFWIEFWKPNTFLFLGLSSIQYLCLICLGYYYRTLRRLIHHAYKKIHVL